MTLKLLPMVPPDTLTLFPLLREADEDDERVRAALLAPENATYAADDQGQRIGAAVVAWDTTASELLLLAVAAPLRGQGYGRQIIAALVAEAHARGIAALVVGTANSSLDAIKLYQQCGFRMDHVRRDYFAYVQPPISEDGIPLRDMLVLRMDLMR